MALRQRLLAQSRQKLLELRRFFSVEISPIARKASLVDAIEKRILTETDDILRVLPEYELRTLQALSHLPAGHRMVLQMPSVPFFMDILDLMDSTHEYSKKEMTLALDDDLREALSGTIDKIVATGELEGTFRFDRLFFGMLVVYGVFPVKSLFEVIEKNYTEQDREILLKRLQSFSPLAFCKSREWLCHPYVDNPIDVIVERKARGIGDNELKPFSADYLVSVGKSGPYFAPDMATPHGERLISLFQRKRL